MSAQLKVEREETPFVSQSMATDLVSDAYNVKFCEGYCVHFVWSAGATPIGSVKIQVSIDKVNWEDLEDSPQEVTGNTGSQMIDVVEHNYSWVRFAYTRTSGSGTLNTKANFRTRAY